MLHLISYLILKDVQFTYYPGETESEDPNVLKFSGRERPYVIHEYHHDIFPRYYLLEYDGGKPIISNVASIELFDVVAALI